jgi:multicomponent Na+:H+ antiporter subunit E
LSDDDRRGYPARFSGLLILWLLLFLLWLAMNSSTALPVSIAGAVISLVISWIFNARGDVWRVRFTPAGLWHFSAYTGIFIAELVKANLNMLRYVYAPRIEIHPGIVKIHTRLTSPIGRLALANSIALTPGSLVMDIRDDTMFIHWLDVKTTDPTEASALIAGPYEKHLEGVFG